MTKFSEVAYLYSNPFNPIKVMVDGKHIQYLINISTCKDGGKHYVFISCTDEKFSNEVEDDSWSPLNDDETLSRIKPLLYPLSAMTEEHAMELCKMQQSKEFHNSIEIYHLDENSVGYLNGTMWHGNGVSEYNEYQIFYNRLSPAKFNYLLSKRYDLFGLIESNEAIDITTLNQTT